MKVFSVSELNRQIKNCLEEQFSDLWIEGEISNLKPASSGHLYFSLKDSQSQVSTVMFRGATMKMRFQPENGLSVLAYGRLTVYEPRGNYQIIVEHMEPKGVGALQLAFEQLKKKLSAEGLFDESRKKPLPFLPKKIGIVTSPTGAVIRDMIHVLTRRFPNIQILLRPVLVQGPGAAQEIAEAVHEMNERHDIDVLIVGRGGGSVEDLWAFNEEVVARAIAQSKIPVISAVGHETDFTIADFVADVRAPTPSAAAELAVPVREELFYTLEKQRRSLYQNISSKIENYELILKRWEAYFRDPGRRLTESLLKIDHIREQMISCMEHRFSFLQQTLNHRKEHLTALNPTAILARGYAVAKRISDQQIIRDAALLKDGDAVEVQVYEGRFKSRVLKNESVD
ncbi:MAG: exodeoxyribonuclease VII large subunit [Deltaproteobacteria bacterium]|nr:MAG: exodeoxyribonuclease VII large subunit [Deltaproteobacteria bacterium]